MRIVSLKSDKIVLNGPFGLVTLKLAHRPTDEGLAFYASIGEKIAFVLNVNRELIHLPIQVAILSRMAPIFISTVGPQPPIPDQCLLCLNETIEVICYLCRSKIIWEIYDTEEYLQVFRNHFQDR